MGATEGWGPKILWYKSLTVQERSTCMGSSTERLMGRLICRGASQHRFLCELLWLPFTWQLKFWISMHLVELTAGEHGLGVCGS